MSFFYHMNYIFIYTNIKYHFVSYHFITVVQSYYYTFPYCFFAYNVNKFKLLFYVFIYTNK